VTGELWLQGEPQLKPSSVQRKTKRKEKQKLELQTARRGSAFLLCFVKTTCKLEY
jgi:hypothetical protein